MICEACGSDTKVIDSKRNDDMFYGSVYRRRECLNCGHRFATYELARGSLMELKDKAAIDILSKVNEKVSQAIVKIYEEFGS